MSAELSHADLQERVEVLAQEVSHLTQVGRELADENRHLRILIELACLSNAAPSLDWSLQHFADRARDVLDSEVVCIVLIDPFRGDLVWGACSDLLSEDLIRPIFPVQPGGTGASVLKTRCGILIEDVAGQKNVDAIITGFCRNRERGSVMVGPVGDDRDCLGMIYAFRFKEPCFQGIQLNLLALLGHLVGSEVKRRGEEAKLRESEERFRYMVETTGDVLYRLRYHSMQYDYLSPSIQGLTGYGQDEIQAIGFSRLVARIDTPGRENVPADLVRSKRVQGELGEYRADYLIETKQGEFKWVRDHSFPWLDEQTAIIGSVGILSDISDYKRAEARVQQCTNDLIESEEKYRTLVENVPLVVYRMGSCEEILFVNKFFQEVFGYRAVEVFATPTLWTESVYEDDRETVVGLRSRCYREGEEFLAEYRVVHKNGHVVYILDHAVPCRNHEGQVVGLDGIIIDMSDKVRFQDYLLQTQGLKTLSEISARLAHEIRNPLVSAGGFARLLLTHMRGDDPNRTKAEIIVKEVGRLEAILHMLLNYIKPLDLQICSVDLNAMIKSILDSLSSELKNKKIFLQKRLAYSMAPVFADSQQMERALEAILRNTVDQCKTCGTLRISTLQQNKTFVMNIRYPVHHISEDDIEHFFYPFASFAACQSNTELPLSKIIINKHGGQTEVRLDESGELIVEVILPLQSDSPK